MYQVKPSVFKYVSAKKISAMPMRTWQMSICYSCCAPSLLEGKASDFCARRAPPNATQIMQQEFE